jgi:hypothetical protein
MLSFVSLRVYSAGYLKVKELAFEYVSQVEVGSKEIVEGEGFGVGDGLAVMVCGVLLKNTK